MDFVCPNCGKRYVDLFTDEDVRKFGISCGDCAQAQVRPRELYQLVLDERPYG